MGITISNLQADVRTFPFPFGGEEAKITYRPSAVTPAKLDAMREIPEEEGDHTIVLFLSEILVEWEVFDDEGQLGEKGAMWPTTPEALAKLPLVFLATVLNAIRGDVSPGDEGKA